MRAVTGVVLAMYYQLGAYIDQFITDDLISWLCPARTSGASVFITMFLHMGRVSCSARTGTREAELMSLLPCWA